MIIILNKALSQMSFFISSKLGCLCNLCCIFVLFKISYCHTQITFLVFYREIIKSHNCVQKKIFFVYYFKALCNLLQLFHIFSKILFNL